MSGKEKILVVGAGVSGLKTAKALVEAGYEVTVLEGRDRCGGRVHTAHMQEGEHIDIGGAWLQYPGTGLNPTEPYVEREGVKQFETTTFAVYDNDGQQLDDEFIAKGMGQMGEMGKVAEAAEGATSVAQAIKWLTQPETDPSIDPKIANFCRQIMENYSASDVENLNVMMIAHLAVPEQKILDKGFEVLVNALKEGLDVKLQHAVKSVSQNEDKTVTVKTDKGDFVGQRVIVTVPLGVLKSKSIAFTPELPAPLNKALEHSLVGVLNKVVLRFPTTFWDDKDFLMYLSPDRSLPTLILNVGRHLEKPILVFFHWGERSVQNEGLSDDALAEKAMVCMRGMYGKDIPNYTEAVCTRWGTDPFSMGSYTSVGVNHDMEGFAKLQDAHWDGHLLFAGESTSPDSTGLIHGAYKSGQRAAKQIIDMSK